MRTTTPASSAIVDCKRLPLTNSEAALLISALSNTHDLAADAWQGWRTATDLDQLPGEQYPLLPTLYANLARLGLTDEADNRLKGIYKRSWYKNQQWSALLPALLASLADAQIPARLIGSVAACLDLYPSIAERSVSQLDLLTTPALLGSTLDRLTAAGWQLRCSEQVVRTQRYQQWRNQVMLHLPGLPLPLNLHWRFLPDGPLAGCEDRSLQLAFDHERPEGKAPTPNIETQLVLAGATAATSPSTRLTALADMSMILFRCDSIAWDQVLEQSQLLQAACALRQSLLTVAGLFDAPLPVQVIDQLAAIGRLEPAPAILLRSGHTSLCGRARFHLQRWRRIVVANNMQPTMLSLLDYLQVMTGAPIPLPRWTSASSWKR